ncbi:hypothetical protein M9Y10_019905 [Tritrichomonas musculus]|uniref:DUF5060 domain-containing protein n=1 Tax=Tritrichomonas musculus TaxID=1915356 RepID=A0ABR2HIW4_9EUKA
MTTCEKWKIFSHVLKGPSTGNPFVDVQLTAVFSGPTERYETEGFYNGNGNYVIRLMPTEEGEWRFVTKSNVKELDQQTGSFTVTAPSANNHGRVLLKRDVFPLGPMTDYHLENEYHFSYEDKTKYLPFGTTCYAWINQKPEICEQTIESLKHSPFNKIRMCIFPKHYTYNTTDPDRYAFEGSREKGFDFTRFNTEFYDDLEHRIQQLDDIGVQADIILLHPYDNWGFSKMTREQDIFYLKYTVSRLSHFKNIWWSLANEFDLMREKSIEDWEKYARVVIRYDPYGHLRSIHNCIAFYDHTKPWITHCSIQRIDIFKTAESITEWRQQYHKPIVVDECAYEGNINYGWGNIDGEEMTRRFWEGCIRGGYLSHGEVYVDKGPQVWWSHGGKLHGTCTERIAFCKKIFEEAPDDLGPLKLTIQNHVDNWDVPCATAGNDKYLLYYFGFFRPLFRTYNLPKGHTYEIDIIDTWDMTIKRLPGKFSGEIKIDLPQKKFIAVRMTEV